VAHRLQANVKRPPAGSPQIDRAGRSETQGERSDDQDSYPEAGPDDRRARRHRDSWGAGRVGPSGRPSRRRARPLRREHLAAAGCTRPVSRQSRHQARQPGRAARSRRGRAGPLSRKCSFDSEAGRSRVAAEGRDPDVDLRGKRLTGRLGPDRDRRWRRRRGAADHGHGVQQSEKARAHVAAARLGANAASWSREAASRHKTGFGAAPTQATA
jgi:hypothetical protein